MACSKKPKASDRTIDFFSGKTNVELKEEALAEDAKDEEKTRTPLSPNDERKAWESRGTVQLKDMIQGFRLTEIKGGYLLERMCWNVGTKEPYAYGIFIFHEEVLGKLRDAIDEKIRKDR